MALEIYDMEGLYQSAVSNLQDSTILEVNKIVIKEFDRYLKVCSQLSINRRIKYIRCLNNCARLLGMPFKDVTRQDVELLVERINDHPSWADATMHDHKVLLKRFYKWLLGGDKAYPEQVSWIKSTSHNTMPIQKSELLTPDELTKVLQVAENGRDRAFIHVLYESGCRIGEIGGLCRRDVHFDTYGVQINVTGKTGSRPIRLVKSAGDFSFWFKHQVQQTPDTPIWSPYGRPDEFLTYARLSAILKLHFKLAGIDKPCNPHIFRHAALTHLSKHLSDQELKIYAGWSKNSKMMDVYSHLTGGDVADKILRMHNIVKDDAQVESQLLSCPRCRAPNQELADYCYNCSHILNQQIAQNTFLEKQKREQAATNKSVYAKLLDDPKVQAFLKEKLSSIIDDEL